MSRSRTAAADAAAPPTSSGTKVPTTAVLTTPARKKAKALFRLKAPALLLCSGDDSKAAQLRQPLLWKLGRIAAQKATTNPCFCAALLRAIDSKERRLTNHCAYTRSAVA